MPRFVRFSLLALVSSCHSKQVADSATLHDVVLVAHNVGTTPYLDAVGDSPHRPTCEAWYDNNLCLDATEDGIMAVLEETVPDIAVLVEVWTPERCDAADRPPEADQAPYVCAREGHQVDRLLPGYRFACAEDDSDLCIAWHPSWTERGALGGLPTDCQRAGRTAHLTLSRMVSLSTRSGPT